MAIDGVSPKSVPVTAPVSQPKPIEPAKVEAPAPAPSVPKAQTGFDDPKQKLMSVSGRYVAPPPVVSDRADLKDLVASQRSLAQANITGSAPAAEASKSSEADVKKLKEAISDGSDKKIRDLVNADPALLKQMSPQQKGSALETLRSGYTTDADKNAMQHIVRSCESKAELRDTIKAATGKENVGQAEFHKYDKEMTDHHPFLVADLMNPDNKSLPPKAGAKPTEAAPVEAPKVDPSKASASGAEYDPTTPKVKDDTPLPKDSKQILENLTQLNGKGAGNERCGSTALVAGAIAKEGGVEGAANLARQLAKDAKNNKDPNNAKIYEDIAKKLSDPKTANYGELGRLSETIFNANAAGDAMSGKDLTRVQKAAGNQPPTVHLEPGHIAETFNTVDKMAPGESWPAKVAVNGSTDGNHWIQIGKDKDGKVFVYDPMPKKGEPQIIYQKDNPEKFAKYQTAMFPAGNDTKGYANSD